MGEEGREVPEGREGHRAGGVRPGGKRWGWGGRGPSPSPLPPGSPPFPHTTLLLIRRKSGGTHAPPSRAPDDRRGGGRLAREGEGWGWGRNPLSLGGGRPSPSSPSSMRKSRQGGAPLPLSPCRVSRPIRDQWGSPGPRAPLAVSSWWMRLPAAARWVLLGAGARPSSPIITMTLPEPKTYRPQERKKYGEQWFK